MTVKEIVYEWLKGHGYDGLVTPGECGCKLDELVPCDSPCSECEAGYIGQDPDGEHDYMIYTTKDAVLDAKDEIAQQLKEGG